MIYSLKGELTYLDSASGTVVIECGGVGYRLTSTANTVASLPSLSYSPSGDIQSAPTVKLYTFMSVKEDAVELFGFKDAEELDTFKLLTSVQGVGPKAAMSILSLLTPQRLALTIASEDTKGLSRAPGIGAKTAARIVLELRDKMAKAFPYLTGDAPAEQSTKKSTPSADKAKLRDAQDALAVLGYSRSEIASAMKNVDLGGTLENIIKDSLAVLTSQ